MNLKRILAASLVISSVLSSTCVTRATVASKAATLNYNNIKISLNNNLILPSDANGNYVEPFAINGTTYLPVRAVGNAMGLEVNWDSTNNTVVLTSGGQVSASSSSVPSSEPRSVSATLEYNDIKIVLDGQNVIPMDSASKPVEPFSINGTTYLPVRGIASILGILVDWDGTTNTVVLETREYAVEQAGATNISGVPDGWLPYSTSNASLLLNAAAKGQVIYRNGQYWCSPEYAASVGNEHVVSIVDVSNGSEINNQYPNLDANTPVVPTEKLVSIDALSRVRTKLGIDKIMSGGTASTTVSDIEVLQYCMPSLPDNFLQNPVSGTYDGIRVVVQNGQVLMYESDLAQKGFI